MPTPTIDPGLTLLWYAGQLPSTPRPVGAGASVIEAIQSYFRQVPALQALTSDGKLWDRRAPENTRLPFAEFFRVSEPDTAYTTAFRLPVCTVQFGFYAPTAAAAQALRLAFESALTMAPLVVAGVPVLHVLPGEPMDDVSEDRGERGRSCSFELLEFEVMFVKGLPT